jgi:hypothetical protein
MSVSAIVRTKHRHSSAHPRSQAQQTTAIDYAGINQAALTSIPALPQRWLPDGRREGSEWTARNPHRTDHHLGSFKVNMRTGRWADFATGDKGGDIVSLAAYLFGLSQSEAARQVAQMLGLGTGARRDG